VAVGIGFLWSIALFAAAVFMRDRAQDSGFGWALAGAFIYVLTFSDHLPGQPTGIRRIFEALPGVGHADIAFASPTVLIIVLLVIYALRMLIFYQLFFNFVDVDFDGDGQVDDVNDLVAPFLSYLCFMVSVIAALRGLYQLSLVAVVVISTVALALYYVPQLWRYLLPYLHVVYEALHYAVVSLLELINDVVTAMILMIAQGELARIGGNPARVSAWGERRRRKSDGTRDAARDRRAKAIADLAREADKRKRSRARHARNRRRSV
jgi:hypothetical protein